MEGAAYKARPISRHASPLFPRACSVARRGWPSARSPRARVKSCPGLWLGGQLAGRLAQTLWGQSLPRQGRLISDAASIQQSQLARSQTRDSGFTFAPCLTLDESPSMASLGVSAEISRELLF
ncbi:hypothetical protein GQ53DRAFT_382235 [Thozetella sp. PMI_491]|nr:hypothetical protein GQ53DRAFT_382235 [Thozetella sp. PMI_491]